MNAANQPQPDSMQPGMSGRRVTIVVLLLLAASGSILSYSLWSYGRLGSVRKDKRAAWAQVREPLATRYRNLEVLVAAGVDDRSVEMAWGEKFRLAVDGFRTTAQIAEQFDAAVEVEDILAEASFEFPAAATSPELLSAVASFNAELDRETQQLKTPGCLILDVFLEFPQPGQFVLTPSP